MDIRVVIEGVLKDKKADFKMLADAIGISEDFLDEALQNEFLQVRILELVSKELRIPLYSFFRDPLKDITDHSQSKVKYYDVNISKYKASELATEMDLLNEVQLLKKQLGLMQAQLHDKERIIDLLEKNNEKS